MSTGVLCAVVFVGSVAFYLLLAGQVSATEIAAALPVAAAIAAFAAAQHAGQDRRLRLRAPWGRVLVALARSLAADTWRVGAALCRAIVRRPPGAAGVSVRQPFRPGGGDALDAGRRALVTLESSLAPNGFVMDVSPSLLDGEGVMLMHRLVPSPANPDSEWPL